jgi:hypothetical protein
VIVEPDRDALRAALDRESRCLVERVRASPHLDAPAPGLEWTAGQVIAHLCVVYRAFALAVRGDDYGPDIIANLGTGSTLPDVVASTNARALSVVSFPDRARLPPGCANALTNCLPRWMPDRICVPPGPRRGTGPRSPAPSARLPRSASARVWCTGTTSRGRCGPGPGWTSGPRRRPRPQ